jgi:glycogen debranching enzyme
VFKPAVFKASKLVVAAGFTKEDAVIAAMKSWLDFEKIKKTKQKEQNNVRIAKKAGAPRLLANKAAAVEMDAVKLSARNALQMLYGRKGLAPGLRAGLPWFFQFWQRDEAVSFGGLARFDRKYIFEIFWRQIGELGRNNFRFQTADGESWLFLRAAQMIKKRVFSFKETARIRDCLERSIENLLEKNTQKCFAINDVGQTWMDSLGRGGACIEVQALRLAMYSLAADLATNGEKIDCCLTLEKELADAVRERMFDGRRLADAFDPVTNEADFTARPNIFLAAYIYPQLLRKQEWIKCFEYALDRLWLNWGGLASLDRGDPRFCAKDAGEDPASYHNGDSWFWVNNIAAIAMARLGRKRFKSYIGKILEASVNDILWNGAIGCASEISSAASYEPAGCVNQAWSNATFLELCRELKI